MKTLLSTIFLLFAYPLHGGAQQLVLDSTRFITGNKCCTQIYYAIPTADKGILFTGQDMQSPGGIIPPFFDSGVNGNVMIGKIDSNQKISWIKIYGGSQADGAGSSVQTPDGGYAVLATTSSDNGNVTGFLGVDDIWLLRIDNLGNLLWEKCYGSPQQDWGISIANTPDHGFIILGGSYGSGDNVPFHYGSTWDADWVVIKTDSMGNVQWSKDLGGTGDEGESGSILSVDNSYYLVSCSNSEDHDCTDIVWHAGLTFNAGNYYILKLDDTGKVLWDSSYGGSGGDAANYAIFDTRDSTIVITGNTSSDDYMVTDFVGEQDMWVIKVNKNGTLLWEKTMGGPNEDYGTGLCADNSTGYMAYGWTHSITIGEEDLWLYELGNLGNIGTHKMFGGGPGFSESSYSIVPYLNGYAATGISNAVSFTEGTTYGDFDGGGPFVSYIDSGTLKVITPPVLTPFIIFPNPAENNVRVIIPDNNAGNVEIINSIGQAVYVKDIKQQTSYININVGKWPQGLYIVKWQGENGSVLTAKLTKY